LIELTAAAPPRVLVRIELPAKAILELAAVEFADLRHLNNPPAQITDLSLPSPE